MQTAEPTVPTQGPALAIDAEELAAVCQRFFVERLAVFGSAARGQMRPDSDVDLLVEFIPGAKIGFIEYGGLVLALSELIGRRVDLVTRPALHPLLRDAILSEARIFYAASKPGNCSNILHQQIKM